MALQPAAPLQVDVVLPVFDEQVALEPSIRRLHEHLSARFPFTWRIVIADDASSDATLEIAPPPDLVRLRAGLSAPR